MLCVSMNTIMWLQWYSHLLYTLRVSNARVKNVDNGECPGILIEHMEKAKGGVT